MCDQFPCTTQCGLHPRSATSVTCECGARITNDDEFKEMFRHYIYAVAKEPAQLSLFRPRLVWQAQQVLGPEAPQDLERTVWCALANASEHFFSKVAGYFQWDDETLRNVLDGWYQLLLMAWTGSEHRSFGKHSVESWSQEFEKLTKSV